MVAKAGHEVVTKLNVAHDASLGIPPQSGYWSDRLCCLAFITIL